VAGADVNTSAAIQNSYFWLSPFAEVDHGIFRNNLCRNITYDGVYLEVAVTNNHSWNFIQGNKFDNMYEGIQTYAIHTVIAGNTFTNVDRGLSIHGTTTAPDAGFVPTIARNTIAVRTNTFLNRAVGIWVNY